MSTSEAKTASFDQASDRGGSDALKRGADVPEPLDDLSGEGFIGSVQRYTALILGMILCGVVMTMALGPMVSWRGVPGPMVTQAVSPIWAALVLFGCLLVSFVMAVGVAKIVNPAVGTFVLGAGLGALSMGSGGYLDILFGSVTGVQVGLETLAWGGVVLLMAAGIYRLTGPLPDQPAMKPSTSTSPREIFRPVSVRAAGAGLLSLVAVFLFAGNDLQGQSLAAATIAGAATGYFGRMLAPMMQPILLYAAPCIFLALGQMVVFGSGTDEVVSTWIQNGGPRLGVPTPLDVAAGALMGISIGIGFSRGFVESQEDR